jgi:hypothetical protein
MWGGKKSFCTNEASGGMELHYWCEEPAEIAAGP